MIASPDNECPFCSVPAERVIDSVDLAFAIEDAFPVSPGHTLIVSRRHVESFFELKEDEVAAIFALVHRLKARLDNRDRPAGFNVGINIGPVAGQTIMHVHVHLIPRFLADVPEPRGGVRNVVPGKGPYPSECEKDRKMTIEITKPHLEAVVNYLTWRHKAELHFFRFMHGVKPMPLNDRFWKLLDHFRELVNCNLERKAGEPIDSAAREFFRLALVTEPPLAAGEYLMEEALQWLQSYETLTRQLDKALANLYEFHGDSFGDLIDSMPLGGRALCERALKTSSRCREGFLNEQEVIEAIKTLPEPWRKLVGKEGYVAFSLQEKAQEYLISWMRHNAMTHEHGEQIDSCKLD
jgi:diadenosine tetraphosphate (Ap4A) HIT family hydrolase